METGVKCDKTWQKHGQKTDRSSMCKNDNRDTGTPLPSRQTIVQPKLELTTPGDSYEREADRMADFVMRRQYTGIPTEMPSAAYVVHPTISRSVSGSVGVAVDTATEGGINASRGGGQPMPEALRSQMESGFGTDFSGVRLHTDSRAADLSQGIQAKAFTYGNDIYFNRGQYSPDTSTGQHLIAHELTHVVQQNGMVGRMPIDPPYEYWNLLAKKEEEREEIEEIEEWSRKMKEVNDWMLNFDGTSLYVSDLSGRKIDISLSWSAVSGRDDYISSKCRSIKCQKEKSKGPIPEGEYTLTETQEISTKNIILGIVDRGEWPGGLYSWGNIRTWLNPNEGTNTFDRRGFSIHGGRVKGSAGCIDLTDSNNDFHKWYSIWGRCGLKLRVDYGTKIKITAEYKSQRISPKQQESNDGNFDYEDLACRKFQTRRKAEDYVFNWLKSRGFGYIQIAAIMGNFRYESNMDPLAVEGVIYYGKDKDKFYGVWTDKREEYSKKKLKEIYKNSPKVLSKLSQPEALAGGGIGQWTGNRAMRMEEYAKEQGLSKYDINLQLKWAWEENRKNIFRPDSNRWGNSINSIEEATKCFMRFFEGVPAVDRSLQDRIGYAKEYLHRYKNEL